MELQGKILNFIGDSITYGFGVSDVNNRYDNIVKREMGAAFVNNYGVCGSRIAYQHIAGDDALQDLCFCGRIFLMDKNADLIVVFGGTNDYGHGDAPFGELTDGTPNTYCGAVDYMMRHLVKVFPNAQIVFMTPARRKDDLYVSTDEKKLPDAKPLKEYCEIIKQKGIEYDISVLDLYEILNVDPNNIIDREKYVPDGLHFNDNGHSLIADCLIRFLKII